METIHELIGERDAKCAAISKERPGKFIVCHFDGSVYLVTDSRQQAELSANDFYGAVIFFNGKREW